MHCFYCIGSHHFGTWDYDEIGKGGIEFSLQEYSLELDRLTRKAGLEIQMASNMKYGQTLVWAAGLVHGGMPQNDMSMSRLSQVTHYFFDGADYMWVPRLSNLIQGKIHLITHVPRCKSPDFAPALMYSCADANIERFLNI